MTDLLIGCQIERETMRSDEPLSMIDDRVRGPQLVWSISGLTKKYVNSGCTYPSIRSIQKLHRTIAHRSDETVSWSVI
jgi:hypothetical protein